MSRHRRPSTGPRRPRLLVAAVSALLVGFAIAGTPLTGASFTSQSRTTMQVSAAADWAPPTVTVSAPTGTLAGSATVSATAADTGSGVASVTLEYSVADSGTWQSLCTDTTAPYSCTWNTALVADGSYDVRATAVDNIGLTAVSDPVRFRIANQIGVVLATVAEPARGAVTLRADYVNPTPLLPLVLWFEYAAPGSSNYTAVPGCGSNGVAATIRTCTWNTSGSGEYDVRAVGGSLIQPVKLFYDVQSDVTIDNGAPSVALTVPAGTLSGTVRLTASATDAETSVVNTAFQYRRTGAATWTTACSVDASPYTCSLATTGLAGGGYDFRAVATDLAGNTATTTVQTRTVDNTVASVAVTSPADGTLVRDAVPVTVDASSTRGVAKVVVEVRPTGSSTWQSVCTATTAPYSCTWDSTAITKGSEDVHAVMTDTAGVTTTSAAVTVTVDNSVLRAQDIQAVNVTTAGKAANGDQLMFTWSDVVNPATVLTGWSGSATPITVTLRDGAVSGSPAGTDWASFGSANLGQVAFGQDYVKARKTVVFNATMTAATQTVAGKQVTVVTVTLGSATSGAGSLVTSNVAGTMRWFPSTAVRSTSGVACSATAVDEQGTADRDF